MLRTEGTVRAASAFLASRTTRLDGPGALIVVDFGREVGGIVQIHFTGSSSPTEHVGLAFSESSLYTGRNSDASSGATSAGMFTASAQSTDGALDIPVSGIVNYTMPSDKVRLGFRYLSVFLSTAGQVTFDRIRLDFSAAPTMRVPNRYVGSFASNDQLLNQIWCAGAYTVQLNTLNPRQGRKWPPVATGWENDAVIAKGQTVLAAGAKRDGAIWSGDMAIADLTAFASTGDLTSTRNALTSLYDAQKSGGLLPWGGPPIDLYVSDTYHTWTLVETATYYELTSDRAWLQAIWPRFRKGLAFIDAKIDSRGLLAVTLPNDWARSGMGGENIEANAILYRALVGAQLLARAMGDNRLANRAGQTATTLAAAINRWLWDPAVGAYRDNPTSTVHPQDGNALAVWYGIADPARAASILQVLRTNWNAIGAVAPEWGGISPFTGSMEILARFADGDDLGALDLIRREWGYMLRSPIGTASTFWEGMSATGGLVYGGAYESLAHGWSSGPTAALTSYVLGISAGSKRFHVVPHPGDLTDVHGVAPVKPGHTVTVAWHHSRSEFTLRVDSRHADMQGDIAIPALGRLASVTIDGHDARIVHDHNEYVLLASISPGVHTVRAVYA